MYKFYRVIRKNYFNKYFHILYRCTSFTTRISVSFFRIPEFACILFSFFCFVFLVLNGEMERGQNRAKKNERTKKQRARDTSEVVTWGLRLLENCRGYGFIVPIQGPTDFYRWRELFLLFLGFVLPRIFVASCVVSNYEKYIEFFSCNNALSNLSFMCTYRVITIGRTFGTNEK